MAGPSPLRKVQTPTSSDRSFKPARQPRITTFHLPPDLLRRFAPDASRDDAKYMPVSSAAPAFGADDGTVKSSTPSENASEPSSTPAPQSDPSPEPKRGATALVFKAGLKRSASTLSDSQTKPRGKPGPKKKPRLEDGSIDRRADGMRTSFGGATPIHKLGPKANQGAINAGLRALDRSGKPCRKWTRKGFQIKSFTGVVWELPSWRAPKKKIEDDGKENINSVSDTSAGGVGNKENNSSSNPVQSEKSSGGDAESKPMDDVAAATQIVIASA